MTTLRLLHLGYGNVGRELKRQIDTVDSSIEAVYGVKLLYCGAWNSKGGLFFDSGLGRISETDISSGHEKAAKSIAEVSLPALVIDTTASEQTIPLLVQAARRGLFVIMSNKKPLTASWKEYRELVNAAEGKLFFETTVGAGLPVIATLQTLLATGDEILEIKGCMSGTLGFLFSELEKGVSFSQAVHAAKEKGYTEPDPRDDLSGIDVARKALILARLIGLRMELSGVSLTGLYPPTMNTIGVNEFLQTARTLDREYAKKLGSAKSQGKTLRYVASISQAGCEVGLEAVPKENDLGQLKGPDNLFVFRTKRYRERPIVIKGPGAGVEVTAAGVLGDIIEIIKVVCPP